MAHSKSYHNIFGCLRFRDSFICYIHQNNAKQCTRIQGSLTEEVGTYHNESIGLSLQKQHYVAIELNKKDQSSEKNWL